MTRTIFLMAAGLLGSGCGDSKNDDDDKKIPSKQKKA